ncbi:Hypothetical Protein FCC1311_099502 [Hondaea fermentalgiana]|uniref:Uncharacterized protein n=1 Tax=Hondaea fermentalgiana TaxID=2315210 RepID=A0A2R5GS67_9STRA|nr:Hypothetical Protein FCC1311_099502 [Hondaea fermentalgiana]|eukprot:GBG33727.1 Hypothetical Protein FCC1311_099502 [Hondaea fermentalgiana]
MPRFSESDSLASESDFSASERSLRNECAGFTVPIRRPLADFVVEMQHHPSAGLPAAEIWALEEKVRALEEKNKALSQENFDLKSELWMRSAEEKHSNAPIVNFFVDLVIDFIQHSNAVALSEGQVERVLIDEVALRLDSGRMDALEAVLRVLSKCIRQRRPSLADGIASALLVPAFVKYYERSRTAVPTHLEMQTCAAIAGFLTPLARRTRKPCAQGKALAQGFANLVNGQQGHLEAWLEAPGNCWAQVLELFSVVTAVQAPQLEAATLPDMYRLLDLHRQQTSFHPMLTPVLEFCASLVLVKPSSISARGDEDPDWRSRLIELLQELADAGFESATWIRITITKAAMKA